MSQNAIEARAISKSYQLGERGGGYRTLREAIVRFAQGGWMRRPETQTFWALRQVSFDVPPGEVLGLIGRNGAGKSTLLKILSRITVPTEGRAVLHGRVGSLLEVGTGFHPELTGRENTFLNGAILGMRRAEIARHFDAIVAFAEVEKFIDTPVKHYSSGMYLRLAFAVAAHLDTEILLVDEVLAVGDAAFQRKCLGKMGEVASAGRTVLFVSHNMGAVVNLCQRALWIESGEIAADGPVEEVAHAYLSTLSRKGFQAQSAGHGLAIRSVVLRDADGRPCERYAPGGDLVVDVEYEVEHPIAAPNLLLTVEGLRATCFTANMQLDGRHPERLEGRGHVLCRFRRIPLLPQTYTVRLGVKTRGGKEHIIPLQDVASFSVTGGEEELGLRGERFLSLASHSSPVVIDYDWVLPDGSVEAVGLQWSEEATAAVLPDRKLHTTPR